MRRMEYPYYKVQYWDQIIMTWHVIEKKVFPSEEEAIEFGKTLRKTFRIQEVERDGRRIVSVHEYPQAR